MTENSIKNEMHVPKHPSTAGFLHFYLATIAVITLFGIVAYSLGKMIPDGPIELREQYDIHNQNYRQGTDFSLVGNTGETSGNTGRTIREQNGYVQQLDNSPSYTSIRQTLPSTIGGGGTGVSIQQGSPSAEQIVAQTSPQPQNLAPVQDPQSLQNSQNTQNQIVPQAQSVFTSSINPRIQFSVPEGASPVKQSGTKSNSTYIIDTEDGVRYTMHINQTAMQCYNTLQTFTIPAGQGIDFRIIHREVEGTLKNGIHRIIKSYEEIGEYDNGRYALRLVGCVSGGTPMQIEIYAPGQGRERDGQIFATFDALLSDLAL